MLMRETCKHMSQTCKGGQSDADACLMIGFRIHYDDCGHCISRGLAGCIWHAMYAEGCRACSLYWHIGKENFGPNAVNIGAALFMITILPAFAACAYIPQLVRHACLLLVKCMLTLQRSFRGCTKRDFCTIYCILYGMGQ